jgi:hypothetical protein
MRTSHAFLITLVFDPPAQRELRGRIRDVATDAEATFQSARELVAFLLAQGAASAGPPAGPEEQGVNDGTLRLDGG